MARFKAKFDYVKERDDVLSFKKGDLFEITSKVDERWWAARAESDNSIGYVPALYLEPVKDKPIGRLVPEDRKNTIEHDYHLEALAELQSKVRPLPAHVLGQALGINVPPEESSTILPYKYPLKKSTPPTNENQKWKSKSMTTTKIPPVVAEKKTRGQSVKEMHSQSIKETHNQSVKETNSQLVKEMHNLSVQENRCYDNIPEADYDDTPDNHDDTDSDVPVMAVRPLVKQGKHVRSSTYNGTTSTEQTRNEVHSPATKNTPRQNNAKHSRHKTTDVTFDRNANPKSPNSKTTIDNKLPYHHQFPPPQEPPPPPDYDLNGEDELNEDGVPYHHQLNKSGRDSSSDDGQPTSPVLRAYLPADDNPVLIQPKPLPNPVKGSRMHKDLHFELKHSGRDVLKPELARVMTQRKHQKSRAELEEEKRGRRTSLEIKLQERQDRLKQEDEKNKMGGESIPEEAGQAELYRVRKSLRSKEATKT